MALPKLVGVFQILLLLYAPKVFAVDPEDLLGTWRCESTWSRFGDQYSPFYTDAETYLMFVAVDTVWWFNTDTVYVGECYQTEQSAFSTNDSVIQISPVGSYATREARVSFVDDTLVFEYHSVFRLREKYLRTNQTPPFEDWPEVPCNGQTSSSLHFSFVGNDARNFRHCEKKLYLNGEATHSNHRDAGFSVLGRKQFPKAVGLYLLNHNK